VLGECSGDRRRLNRGFRSNPVTSLGGTGALLQEVFKPKGFGGGQGVGGRADRGKEIKYLGLSLGLTRSSQTNFPPTRPAIIGRGVRKRRDLSYVISLHEDRRKGIAELTRSDDNIKPEGRWPLTWLKLTLGRSIIEGRERNEKSSIGKHYCVCESDGEGV